MADFSKHIMKDYTWQKEYAEQRGREAYDKFINDIYTVLMKMKPGSFFDIAANVKPDNIDLFVKVCCMWIDEYRHSCNRKLGDSYFIFSDDYTKLIYHE